MIKISQTVAPLFGDGSNGVRTVSADATESPIDSSCSGTSGTTSLSATNASFAAGQMILIHQSRGTGVGQWELNRIASYVAGTITVAIPLAYTYTDSGASQAQVVVIPEYTAFTVNSGITLTAKAWDGNVGGILAFACSGTINIAGTLTGAGKGYIGANGVGNTQANQGEGTTGAGSAASTANGNAGGGAIDANTTGKMGGGSGGHASAGTDGGDGGLGGDGGGTAGAADLTTMVFGGSAGGSAGNSGSTGGKGGDGGSIILLLADKVTVSGAISANGGQGGNASGGGNGSGGAGGAGGSVLIKTVTGTFGTNLITATGGATGSPVGSGYGSVQNGAEGRIRLECCSLTGTTNPSASAVAGGHAWCAANAFMI